MSKDLARGPESYANEERYFEETALLVESNGFQKVTRRKSGSAKIIDAECADGTTVSFWLKLGWSQVPYAAIQFGMFDGPDGSKKSDKEFVQFVEKRVANIKTRGVTHALLVHRGTFAIALAINDIPSVYAEQMRRFPDIARNTKSPTMWFFDPRPGANSEVAEIVMRRGIPLTVLSRRSNVTAEEKEARSRMAEVEARIMQATFRNRVGARCGWRCAVTGSKIRETLDAAHLPGRDWRKDNEGNDGVLLRADIHRLIDAKIAWIEEGKFHVGKSARAEYGQYEGRALA